MCVAMPKRNNSGNGLKTDSPKMHKIREKKKSINPNIYGNTFMSNWIYNT